MGVCGAKKPKKETPVPVPVDPEFQKKRDEQKLLALEEEINRINNDIQILLGQNRVAQAEIKKQGINFNLLTELFQKKQQHQRHFNAMKIKGYITNQGELARREVEDLEIIAKNQQEAIANQNKATALQEKVQDQMYDIKVGAQERENQGINAIVKDVDQQTEQDRQAFQNQSTLPSQTQSNNNFQQQPPNSQRFQQNPNMIPQQQFYQQPQQFGYQQNFQSYQQPQPQMYYLPQNNYQNQMPQYQQGPQYQQQVASVTQ